MLSATIYNYDDLHWFEDALIKMVLPKSSQVSTGRCKYLDTQKYILFRAKVLCILCNECTLISDGKEGPYNKSDSSDACMFTAMLSNKIRLTWHDRKIFAEWIDSSAIHYTDCTNDAYDSMQNTHIPGYDSQPITGKPCRKRKHDPEHHELPK